jgi:hypothetical protein
MSCINKKLIIVTISITITVCSSLLMMKLAMLYFAYTPALVINIQRIMTSNK